jgi:hypothetical protein
VAHRLVSHATAVHLRTFLPKISHDKGSPADSVLTFLQTVCWHMPCSSSALHAHGSPAPCWAMGHVLALPAEQDSVLTFVHVARRAGPACRACPFECGHALCTVKERGVGNQASMFLQCVWHACAGSNIKDSNRTVGSHSVLIFKLSCRPCQAMTACAGLCRAALRAASSIIQYALHTMNKSERKNIL